MKSQHLTWYKSVKIQPWLYAITYPSTHQTARASPEVASATAAESHLSSYQKYAFHVSSLILYDLLRIPAFYMDKLHLITQAFNYMIIYLSPVNAVEAFTSLNITDGFPACHLRIKILGIWFFSRNNRQSIIYCISLEATCIDKELHCGIIIIQKLWHHNHVNSKTCITLHELGGKRA